MKQHRSPPNANYINTHGRTVSQVHEEAGLLDALEAYIAANSATLQGLSPRAIHAELRRFVFDKNLPKTLYAICRGSHARPCGGSEISCI